MRFQTVIYLAIVVAGVTFLYNEFFVYFLVLCQCRWPSKLNDSVRAMILADTHLLGPFRGHWFDKLRREWQMQKSFQTAIWLHRPDVVFILGDVFDEGQWVDEKGFESYLIRFHDIFYTPSPTKVYSAVGNHDIGFHYRLHPFIVNRFKRAFKESHNSLITIKNNHFILLNSMALSRDGCYFCNEAEADIKRMSHRLNCAKHQSNSSRCTNLSDQLTFYVRPILMQHYPTFRESDAVCEEHDSPEIEFYRENWEVLSKNATEFLGKTLNPLIAFSGHSHHYCRTYNMWDVEEYTLASFSWRNKKSPSFILAEFFKNEYAISKCDMPTENTVLLIYAIAGCIVSCMILIGIFCKAKKWNAQKKDN